MSYSRAGGPGGQHVNKTETKALVRIELAACPLDDDERSMMLERWGDEIRVTCEEHRSQLRNRETALQRALVRFDETLDVQRERRATRPSRASVERRLEDKRRRGKRKQDRRSWGE